MSALLVQNPGFGVTIQDLGRPSVQHLGVPVSGALDPVALRLANELVGNPADAAALEFRMMGPSFVVQADSVRVALTGTDATVDIVSGDQQVRLESQRSIRIERGRSLSVGGLPEGGVAYLAVEGGFDLPQVYGSLSTYIRASLGGLEGRALQSGDQLPLARTSADPRGEVRLRDRSWREETGPIRVVLGPQRDFFTDASIEAFFGADYAVTRDADRMGMRLDGPALQHARGFNIVSDGIVTGAIQVPGNGLPIVLLADHQTTGGYPKLGTVISADIPRMGRLRPGDTLRFEEIDVADAEEARRALESRVDRLVSAIEPADGWLDERALYEQNLVSGVIAGEPDTGPV